MDALQCLQVDGHVRGHLPPLLFSLLFSRLFEVATIHSLCEKLPEAWVLEDLDEDLVGGLDFAESEVGHADLGQGPVVEDLIVDVLKIDDLADVRLLEEVLGAFDIIMKSHVVDLKKGRFDTHLWLAMILNQLNDAIDLTLRVFQEVDLL